MKKHSNGNYELEVPSWVSPKALLILQLLDGRYYAHSTAEFISKQTNITDNLNPFLEGLVIDGVIRRSLLILTKTNRELTVYEITRFGSNCVKAIKDFENGKS